MYVYNEQMKKHDKNIPYYRGEFQSAFILSGDE